MTLAQSVLSAVRSVVGEGQIALHEPWIPQSAHAYIGNVLDSKHLSAGRWVDEFEKMLCQLTGAKYAVATCSGTCALEVALACDRIHGNNEYLKIPSLTFVATANAALHAGRNFWFTEPEDANLPVHILGQKSKAKGRIHDAAQALGSNIGDYFAAIYSFNQNKIISTGGGGAIVTNDEAFAREIRHLITTARIPHPYKVEHDSLAWNYRMPDLNAAVGVAQLAQFDKIIAAKRALYHRYVNALSGIDGVKVWKMSDESNHWLTAIQVDDPGQRIEIIVQLHNVGIMCRMLPTPLHKLEFYQGCDKDDMQKTEDTWQRTICLPGSPKLGMMYV